MRLPGARRLGRALRRLAGGPAGLVIAYHRVGEPGADPWGLAVSPGRFAEHAEVLATLARPVPLARLARDRRPARRGPLPVAVTFDDGYAGALHAALPLLERRGIPATVFLATGWTGRGREFWWDDLARLVLGPGPVAGAAEALAAAGLAPGAAHDPRDPPEAPPGRDALHLALWRHLRDLPEGGRERALDRLAAAAGRDRTPRETHRPLTAEEAARLARSSLVEVGAHTVTHPLLSSLPVEAQRAEVRLSLARCEELAGGPVTSFAYPFGGYSGETLAAVREAGLAVACTTEADLVRPGHDPLELPRLAARDWDGEALARRLAARQAG